jgi:hypothetical protein
MSEYVLKRKHFTDKYCDGDFENKNNVDKRIYYGGNLGNIVFNDVYQKIVELEILYCFEIIKNGTLENYYDVIIDLFRKIGSERNFIARLTNTPNYSNFGVLTCENETCDFISDDITAWPNWVDELFLRVKYILNTYSVINVNSNANELKYILGCDKHIITFIISYKSKNEYKCYLLNGNKVLNDFRNLNLSSCMLTWTYHCDSISKVHSSIVGDEDNKLIDPVCYHMGCEQSLGKVFSALHSAIMWDVKEDINQLKSYLSQFYHNFIGIFLIQQFILEDKQPFLIG